ncbi:MAG: zinc ribbon domain-containing protein [Gammaproteobacteria bacterium]|nr:MAG: zinc ribbon domain-containing protein [Gammaproteobacteria bacterium]
MPIYEYECKFCEKVFEVQQRMADKPVDTCPDCGEAVKKLISKSSFQLKGGGWYADGYDKSKSNQVKPKP